MFLVTSCQSEIFFHFSNFDGNSGDLEVGHDVEFSFTIKNDKMSAEFARLLPKRSIPRESLVTGETVTGTVVRTCRCLNPEQDAYPGLVKMSSSTAENPLSLTADLSLDPEQGEEAEKLVEFSMTSLTDVREFIQKGDSVSFQVGLCPITGKERAVGMKIIRNKRQVSHITPSFSPPTPASHSF